MMAILDHLKYIYIFIIVYIYLLHIQYIFCLVY